MARRFGLALTLALALALVVDAYGQGVVWTAPPGWTVETPSSSMRRAQYRIAGPGGEAECVVFYFGPGQGGDAKANVARWAGQFRDAGGPKTRDLRAALRPAPSVPTTCCWGRSCRAVRRTGSSAPSGPARPSRPSAPGSSA